MSSILPFSSPQRRVGIEISPYGLAQLEDAIGAHDTSHLTTTLVLNDGGTIREFLVCLTCKDGGFDVAIELFSDDPGARMCPVEGAERVYRETVSRLWEDSVGHARRRGAREGQQFRDLLAAAK